MGTKEFVNIAIQERNNIRDDDKSFVCCQATDITWQRVSKESLNKGKYCKEQSFPRDQIIHKDI